MKRYAWVVIVFILAIFACGEAVREDGIFDSFTGSGPVDEGSTGDGSTVTGDGSGSNTGGSEDTGDDIKLDVMAPTPTDVMIDEDKCKKIDFLFVIDDSGSMSDEQMSLINSFPGFINGVLNYVPSIESFHLGVTTVSLPVGNPVSCQKKGALVTSTVGAGANSSESICGPYADGYNFMTENDDLTVTFPCAAQVGTNGWGNEQPLMSMIEGLENFIQSPGQCNEGFVREDAVLVVVIITDEDDQSGGNVVNWYDHLVWLKGAPEDIVILSLCETEACSIGYNTSYDLMDFTNFFANGFIGEVCAANYDPFFYQALGVIQTACGGPPIE